MSCLGSKICYHFLTTYTFVFCPDLWIFLLAANSPSSCLYSVAILQIQEFFFLSVSQLVCGPSSSVSIMTGYGVDGPGIESRWGGEIFRTCPDRPWGPPSLLYNGYRVFPGGKERPGRDADPSRPPSAVVKKTVELYLYSPYGSYGLYSARVPV